MHIENLKAGDSLIIVNVTMDEPGDDDEGVSFIRAARAHYTLQSLYGEPLCVVAISPPFVRVLGNDGSTHYLDSRDYVFSLCSDDYAACETRVRPDAPLLPFIDVKAAKSLEAVGITNIAQAVQYSREDLSKVRNVGEKTLRQLSALAVAAGFNLEF